MLIKRFKHLSTDREAPVIDGCPGDIKVISTDRFPKLVLPGVKVTDNVGVYHFVTNIQNGSEVTFGQHHITYTASDKAGNKAYCRFNITIAGTNNFQASSRDHNNTCNFDISVFYYLRIIIIIFLIFSEDTKFNQKCFIK